MAHWFFERLGHKIATISKVAVSISYAVSMRAYKPLFDHSSPGDLFMNLAGVAVAAFVYSYMTRNSTPPIARVLLLFSNAFSVEKSWMRVVKENKVWMW